MLLFLGERSPCRGTRRKQHEKYQPDLRMKCAHHDITGAHVPGSPECFLWFCNTEASPSLFFVHHEIEQRRVLFLQRQDGVAQPAIGANRLPLSGDVIVSVAAQASRAGSVSDVVGVGPPPDVHSRPNVSAVDLLHLLRRLLQQRRIGLFLRMARRTMPTSASRTSLPWIAASSKRRASTSPAAFFRYGTLLHFRPEAKHVFQFLFGSAVDVGRAVVAVDAFHRPFGSGSDLRS